MAMEKRCMWVIAALVLGTAMTHATGSRAETGERRGSAIERPSPRGAQARTTPWLRDVAYGQHPKQRLDVYRGDAVGAAPVIVMVHGGAWRTGDKAAASVVGHKVARWVPRGFVFVSVNNRLLPEADAYQQAEDVARAIAHVQAHAKAWGGDPERVIVMGHSAGAHLVALLGASPRKVRAQGGRRWLGTVALDSAVLDVPAVLGRPRVPDFYVEAFGRDPQRWSQGSPLHALGGGAIPLLAVCSSQRRDQPCRQAEAYAARSNAIAVASRTLPLALSHRQINDALGTPGALTTGVEAFMASLDPVVAARLRPR